MVNGDPYGDRAGPSNRQYFEVQHSYDGRGMDIGRQAEIVVKGKEKARAAEERWTDPVNVLDGVFEGRIVRFLFKCVQEPVSGRRKTDKDRRSLAPVPIVRMWVKECYQDVMGGWSESDLDLSDIDPSCLICEAEISPPVDLPAGVLPQSLKTQGPSNVANTHLFEPSHHVPFGHPYDGHRPPLLPYYSTPGPRHNPIFPRIITTSDRSSANMPSLQHRSSWISDQHWDTRSVAGPSGTMQGYPEQVQHLIADAPGDTGRTRKLPHAQPDEELEGSGRSGKKARLEVGRNLFGALHVSGVKVVAPSGELGLWFLFTDLCVGTEGNYRLRFRVFDLSVIKPQMPPVPHFANCESEIFKVWAPKAFPGIPKPTELTEHFIKQGFKLNARKNERTARTPPPE